MFEKQETTSKMQVASLWIICYTGFIREMYFYKDEYLYFHIIHNGLDVK